ncbi:MAG TPA: tetratricopeptide repeat protein [Actinomycetota bacterium]|nr:tetratricopeptide repeat protein [Actinomycetota bacterium]
MGAGPDATRLHMSAVALHLLGRLNEAEANAREALALLATAGDDEPALAALLSDLGAIIDSSGRYVDAELLHRRAGALLVSKAPGIGFDHQRVRSARGLAANLRAQDRNREAHAILMPALAYAEQLLGPDDPDTLSIMVDLGAVCEPLGRTAEAEDLYRQVLARLDLSWPARSAEVAAVAASLSDVLDAVGKVGEAGVMARRAVEAAARSISDPWAGVLQPSRLAELVVAAHPG